MTKRVLLTGASTGIGNATLTRLLASGHEVTSLKRVRFGGLELGTLQPGAHREILHKEITKAFSGAPHREV